MTDHERGMEMSNAMIEAACSATILGEDEQGRPVHLSPEEARTAITAAISAYLATTAPSKPVAEVVKVKPLEWVVADDQHYQATTAWDFGYEVRFSQFRGAVVARNTFDFKWADFPGTIDEAKAAAQADYEQRVMSALSTPPQPEDAVKVKRVMDDPCIAKLRDDEPFFVLLGRDPDAAHALSTWFSYRVRREGRSSKTDAAEKTLDAFRAYRDGGPALSGGEDGK